MADSVRQLENDVKPDWYTAQKAMRENVKYAAALEQIKIVAGPGTPSYQVADAALRGK